jgi:NAD(P)-dependent dehydrogenase (short-subunit alcohol dehydrogenase family)
VRLEGKTAVITGAGSGIGRAIANVFAREGATVVVHSRSQAHADETAAGIEQAQGRRPHVIAGAIEDPATSERIAGELVRHELELDAVVLNAGIDNFEPVDVVPRETWDQVVAVNLRGVYLACQALLPLVRRPGGSIVHVASVSALVGSPGMAAYSASKGGQVSLARQMAIDFAPQGIRVNSICPGSIDTPMLRAGFEAASDPGAAERACISKHPLGRLGTAEEVAQGALYLASDEASFVTGAQLVIDGGYSAV